MTRFPGLAHRLEDVLGLAPALLDDAAKRRIPIFRDVVRPFLRHDDQIAVGLEARRHRPLHLGRIVDVDVVIDDEDIKKIRPTN